ncbi:MAG: efflux RND transporter periplasmic adaptor subunit [Acidobacteriota bacterium]
MRVWLGKERRGAAAGWSVLWAVVLVALSSCGGDPGERRHPGAGGARGPAGSGAGPPAGRSGRPDGRGHPSAPGRPGRAGAGGGQAWAARASAGGAAAVPVQVAAVTRRNISSFIETNGTLEAENEVDLVGRISAPVVELAAEEGMTVRKGQVLARLDDNELLAQLEIDRVNLNEAKRASERAQSLRDSELISSEDYDAALTNLESAQARVDADRIELGYTRITAPFDGVIVARYVHFAQQVSPNTQLFRISNFDPLLCPIRVPERELPRLRTGQAAYLEVEAWPEERFAARVLRISPVVEAATGTVKVTLEVRSQDRLRPGMFARAFVETDTRQNVLVIPRAALALESLGDAVYVVENGVAARRDVSLGFQEGDSVEVVEGLAEDEPVVVVGQDGLTDGTPVQILGLDRGAGPRNAEPPAGRDGGVPSGTE